MKYCIISMMILCSFNVFGAQAWTGPAGETCKTANGDEGKQSWTTHNGRGYWTCCLPGTSCNRNPKSELSINPRPDMRQKVSH
jgi:hypothetical protein